MGLVLMLWYNALRVYTGLCSTANYTTSIKLLAGGPKLTPSFADSTISSVLPGGPAPASPCCFELAPSDSPGGAVVPPEGGYVDLNATCSQLGRPALGTGALSCDTPAAPLAMANRTLFIRSEEAGGRGVWGGGGEVAGGAGRGGPPALRLLGLLWTYSYKFRTL
jgi:hypothetical protein